MRITGYTLIEVMLVVAVVGIVAAIGIPSMKDIVSKHQARTELNRVEHALNQARARALVKLCRTLVTIDSSARTITISSDSADTDTTCVGLSNNVIELPEVTLGNFLHGSTVMTPLVFNKDGSVQGATQRVRLSATARGKSATFEIWPAIGVVRRVS